MEKKYTFFMFLLFQDFFAKKDIHNKYTFTIKVTLLIATKHSSTSVLAIVKYMMRCKQSSSPSQNIPPLEQRVFLLSPLATVKGMKSDGHILRVAVPSSHEV